MEPKTYNQRAQAVQAGQQAAWTDLCSLLEHAPDKMILSDYTARLVLGTAIERQPEALRLIRGQLYSRSSRDVGRVDSWFEDCRERCRKDPEAFVKQAGQEYGDAVLDEDLRRMHAEKASKQRKKLRVRPACDFAPETAEYLVEPYLPRGMVSILGGVSGAGKTSLALDICARLTRGEKILNSSFGERPPPLSLAPLDSSPKAGAFGRPRKADLSAKVSLTEGGGCEPCEQTEGAPSTVIYLTAENDPNKVLRPRAEAMGADLTRLYFQDGASYSMGDEELYSLCRQLRPGLLVFDPIQSYLGQGVQMNRAEQVRPLLDALGALAKELDMAVLLISHMSKPGPGVCSALDRLLGSSDFRNAARSILIVGRDPEHPGTRVFAHAKNSLGIPGESQQYHICDNGTVAYDGPCDLTADRIIQEIGAAQTHTRPAAALNAAVEALDRQLSFVGWVEYAEVERLCAKHGFSERTMQRARIAMELKSLHLGKYEERKTVWYRPELKAEAVMADYYNQHEQMPLGAS